MYNLSWHTYDGMNIYGELLLTIIQSCKLQNYSKIDVTDSNIMI